MPKSMSDLKAWYSAWTGMRRMFSQVLATGNREWVMNWRLGFGEKPSAGMLSQPVKKTRISTRDTSFSTVKHQKRVTQLNDYCVDWYFMVIMNYNETWQAYGGFWFTLVLTSRLWELRVSNAPFISLPNQWVTVCRERTPLHVSLYLLNGDPLHLSLDLSKSPHRLPIAPRAAIFSSSCACVQSLSRSFPFIR